MESTTPLIERRRRSRSGYRRARRSAERVSVLGIEVDLVRPEEVMHHVAAAVTARTRWCIANHNAHSIYLTKRNPEFAAFFDRADLIEVDSAPLIAFTRMLGLQSRIFHRCTYLDWREHFWSLASRSGWSVFYLGGAPGVAEEAARRLAVRYPGVRFHTRHGYFDPASAENDEVLAEMHAAKPDIVFVGMGMPRQELWIARNWDRLPQSVVFSVGAAFDYEADVQSPAPRWMGQVGLEWLFRLCGDPYRLFSRYCIEPWLLIGPALRDVAKAAAAGRLFRSARRTRAGSRTEAPG